MTMTIIGNCPLCKRHSLTSVEEREVIGVTTCKMTGNKSVMSKKLDGIKCPLCNYNNVKTMIVDSKDHRIA
jgi:transcription elongation factor Elf1